MISVRCGSTFVLFSVSRYVCTVIMRVFDISRVREIEGYDFELAHGALRDENLKLFWVPKCRSHTLLLGYSPRDSTKCDGVWAASCSIQ